MGGKEIAPEIREKLLQTSPGTIDRLLAPAKTSSRRKRLVPRSDAAIY